MKLGAEGEYFYEEEEDDEKKVRQGKCEIVFASLDPVWYNIAEKHYIHGLKKTTQLVRSRRHFGEN